MYGLPVPTPMSDCLLVQQYPSVDLPFFSVPSPITTVEGRKVVGPGSESRVDVILRPRDTPSLPLQHLLHPLHGPPVSLSSLV